MKTFNNLEIPSLCRLIWKLYFPLVYMYFVLYVHVYIYIKVYIIISKLK